jgi:hypothetical protein
MLSIYFLPNAYSSASTKDLKEAHHVFFVNHHLFAAPGNYYRCYTKQYAFGFQVFDLEFSDIFHGLDFLFLSHRWSHCGGFDLAWAGKKISSGQEHEQGNPYIEGKDSRAGKKTW